MKSIDLPEQKITTNFITLSTNEFLLFNKLIEQNLGIKMPIEKKELIQSRLFKRLKSLNITKFRDYYEFLISSDGKKEFDTFIDLISTHVTNFFREEKQFTILYNTLLPEMCEKNSSSMLKFWSAGCSSGEEPYSIAITLAEYLLSKQSDSDFEVTATDISPVIIEKAKKGIYPVESINNISENLKKRYFLKSKDKTKKNVKLIQAIRQRIIFTPFNLINDSYNYQKKYDGIFCRNVLIYFTKEKQKFIIQNLMNCLKDDGFLFLGHSETIIGLDLKLKNIGANIFRKM